MSGVRQFEWDNERAALNFKRHGVTFQTAALIFTDEHRVEEYDFYASFYRDCWKIIGTVENIALVVYSDRADFTRIISARQATKSERRYYDEMSTVTYFLPEDAKPTPAQQDELATLSERRMLNFDKDCMPSPVVLNWEMQRLHRKYRTRRITKEIWYAEHPDGFFSAPYDL